MFKNRGMHFIHLQVYSLLRKIEEICHLVESANASVIGNSETKLDEPVLNSEIVIDGYDLIRLDRPRKGDCVACFIKHSPIQSYKTNMCLNTESIFKEIHLAKSKSLIIFLSTLVIV